MKLSKDILKARFLAMFTKGMADTDPDAIVEGFTEIIDDLQKGFIEDINTFRQTQDSAILAKRGVRQLTDDENKFYGALIKAYESGDIRQSFTGLSDAFPLTVIDAVLEDIQTQFPLLAKIKVQNTGTISKILINKQGVQLAIWGALTTATTEELGGAIGKIDLVKNILTAFIYCSKDMLVAGPVWMDAYVRAILVEANGMALCKAIVAGTGHDEPIGMIRDVSDDVSINSSTGYPAKTAVVITEFTPTSIGNIIATIATGPNGRMRAVPLVQFIVNPVMYFQKILPATTYLTAAGAYAKDVFPYPVEFIQDINVPNNQAIMGITDKYWMGIGVGGAGGKIEADDSYRFLQGERTYITKMYGDGLPLDDNAFILLDITNLVPKTPDVNVTNASFDVEVLSGALTAIVSNFEQMPKALNVTSIAGGTLTKTALTIAQSINAGNTYKYKTAASVELPNFKDVLTTGWTVWNGSAEIVAVTGQKIVLVEVDSANKCRAVGEATVASKDS